MQSAAIAALICKGELKPDLGVIIDTEREMSTTWEYHENVIVPELAKVGFELERVNKSEYATVDLYSKNGGNLIPVHTDGGGKLPTFCSTEWKIRPMQRWASRKHGVKQANVWLGITIDELRRVKQVLGKWQNRYPLIERRMSRADCIALVESMGWPKPKRSSCWMCPNHTRGEWKEQKERGGQDWENAVAFEAEIRKKDDGLYLVESDVTINDVDLDDRTDDMFTGRCDSGYCFT